MTTLSANQLASSLDFSGKTILLPVETEAVVVYPTRPDFPTLGRLKRFYVADDLGTLWRWTGTSYHQAPGTIDAGEY
jgi:hypothetical protein